MNNNDPTPHFRRSPLAKPDGPIRKPRDPRVTDLSRRVQLIGGSPMTPNVGDDLPKRGKPVAEPTAPPRRPGASSSGPAVQARPPAPVPEIEAEPEPEDPDWDLDDNRQRLKKLLAAEWRHWGPEHRQEFEDTIVEAVGSLYTTVKTSEAELEPED